MQQQAGQMMPPRLRPVHLGIQHVGHPRQGVPIGGLARPQRPLQTRPRNPSPDMDIVRHVKRVVETDEIKTGHRPIDRQNPRGEDQAARPAAPALPK